MTYSSKNSSKRIPFLKWLGGKRWLTTTITEKIVGKKINRYIEPFLGGGAVFFSLGIKPAILSDLNSELINTYIQVRDNPDELISHIKTLKTDSHSYYQIRNTKPKNLINRAARFIYLNRTAFGGIYRVNGKGEFNVPFGNYINALNILWEDNLILEASKALEGVGIVCSDFDNILSKVCKGDLVYCDPIYTTMHNNNGFRQYNEHSFSWTDQQRLAKACMLAAKRGAMVLVSNAFHNDLLGLYDGFDAHICIRKSVLCPIPSKRKTIQEYLFINKTC